MERDDKFYILHVEDEPEWAKMKPSKGGPIYEGPLRNVVEQALGLYGVQPADIVWEVAPDRPKALAAMDDAEALRPSRGYDAVFCDLLLPGDDGKHTVDSGLDVLARRAQYRWPGAVVVFSNFADDRDALSKKDARRRDIDFDEWLQKSLAIDQYARATVAKLQRCLLPLSRFARRCEHLPEPFLCVGPRMLRLLREVVVAAHRPVTSWPLTKMLLLGEPGSGKGALVRTFHSLLPTPEGVVRGECQTVNCASLVSEGEGGRIALFGAENFQAMLDQPGYFERATCYEWRGSGWTDTPPPPNDAARRRRREGHAPVAGPDDTIDWSRAGVVFLDEFAELNRDIQASILNALEEGEVRRAGSHNRVPIGCHVIFATNAQPRDLSGSGTRIREDLIDRIPIILRLPSLRERLVEEPGTLERLISGMVARRLNQMGPTANITWRSIEVSKSTLALLDQAVTRGDIRSMRHLQSIADVWAEENVITDGNLRQLLAKADLLGARRALTQGIEDTAISKMAQALALPHELRQDNLPQATASAIETLYGRKKKILDVLPLDQIGSLSEETKRRFILLSKLLSREDAGQLYSSDASSMRTRRSEVAKECGVNIKGNTGKAKAAIVEYLLK